MKKTFLFLLLTSFLFISSVTAQISNNTCSDFKNYPTLRKDTSHLKTKDFSDVIMAYGPTKAKAKYNAKIMVLRQLTGNQMYLNNERVDSILAEFAGELVYLLKDEYDLTKTKKKDRNLGLYKCFVYEIQYNPDLLEYLQDNLNNFIKASVTFIINPYIDQLADAPTKELYKKALGELHTQCLQPKYKFDNVIENRLLVKAKLEPKPANYNPAVEFKNYKTGNKYLDYVQSITNNENRSRQVDIVLSIDTITITKQSDGQRLVNFHIIGYNTHTATEILVYDSKMTINASNDYDAVDQSINQVFKRDISAYMYDMVKRFSSYVRDGALFSLKVSDSLLNDDINDNLEYNMSQCQLFAKGSIAPGEWRYSGASIGASYEGRTYMMDRLALKINMKHLLKNSGLKDFNIDISGTDFIITPKKKQ